MSPVVSRPKFANLIMYIARYKQRKVWRFAWMQYLKNK